MPWKVTCPMDQRFDFIIEHRSAKMSISALCRLYGISRETGHKWIRRFSPRRGEASLRDQSRRPLHSPAAASAYVVEKIVSRRKQYPTWGARKLLWLLQQQFPKVIWPAASTVQDILKRNGLVRPRKQRPRIPPRTRPFSHCREPNDVWCVDFKGHFRTSDGTLVYPLTVTDAASRFLFACTPFRAPESAPTRKVFEQLFRKYGLPKAIRSDNGEPFVSSLAPAGLSKLSAWWVKLGIAIERTDPASPEQNGRHERMHLTLKIETALPPQATFRKQAIALERFRHVFNHQRPHEGIGMKTPASVYVPSSRRLPEPLPQLQYPFADLLRVDPAGSVRWANRKYFISSALARELLGLYILDNRYAELRFASVLLGLLDLEEPKRGLIRIKPPRKPRVSAMSSD